MVKRLVAIFRSHPRGHQRFEIKLGVVHQMRRHHVLQGSKHGLGTPGVLLFPLSEHISDLLALHRKGDLLGNPLLVATFRAHDLTLHQIGLILGMKEQSVGLIDRKLNRLIQKKKK